MSSTVRIGKAKSNTSSVRETVELLRSRGFAVCKPDPAEKKPTYHEWGCHSLERSDFQEGDQVGIIGGPLSNGNRPGYALVRIDLDTEQAILLADDYLPDTGMIEGRPGKPRSHRDFLVSVETIPAWAVSKAKQAAKAAEEKTGHPGPFKKQFRHRETGKCVIDFIGTGGQAVCPPSLHFSGERREWEGGTPGDPAEVAFPKLWKKVCLLAEACGCKPPSGLDWPWRKLSANKPIPSLNGSHSSADGVSEDNADVMHRAQRYVQECPPAISGRGGHNSTFAVACALVHGFALPTESAMRLLRTHYNPRCDPPWNDTELQHKVDDAAQTTTHDKPRGHLRDTPPPDGEPSVSDAAESDSTPTITIGTDEHRVNGEATAALGTEPDLYQRGGVLVEVIEQHANSEPTALVRHPVGSPVIRELSTHLLRERLTRCAHWVQITRQEQRPAHPPGWSVQAVYARGAWPGVRWLEAVVTHPVMLDDGSVLATDGYHCPTRILVRMPHGLLVTVPESPSRDEVAAAVALLSDAVCDFPFERSEHRGAWMAGLLTPLAWFAFDGPAPLFLIDKNVRGAGAGLLADVIGLIVTGRRFPVMSYTSEREELRKRITTLAVEGERLVLLDNLSDAVGNDILDAALTADRWKDRLLGGNRVYDGPLHVCWYGTGNNVQLRADTARRVCHVRMETPEERPELRTGFRYADLRAHIRENRGRLLSAALTILRGWVVAGKPRHGLPAWGSFEGWSGVIREAVVFAGLPDPGETRLALQNAADRDAEAMTALLVALQEMDPCNRGVTVAEIIDTIRKSADLTDEWVTTLKSSVEELCGRLDGRSLGCRLRHFTRRNFGGRMLDKSNPDHGSNRWVVRAAERNSQGPG